MAKTFKKYLESKNACSEGMAFVGDKTLKQAWESFTRPDWMLWLMEKAGYQDDQLYRLYACWCTANTPLGDGRVTWDILTDKRSRKAILVAIDFANGEATQEELAAAGAAAWDAAWTAARAAAGAAAGDAARDAQAKELRRRVDFKKLERLVNADIKALDGREGGKAHVPKLPWSEEVYTCAKDEPEGEE